MKTAPRWSAVFVFVLVLGRGAAGHAAPGDVVRTLPSPEHATYPLALSFDGDGLLLANINHAADPESPNAIFRLDRSDGEVTDRFEYTAATGGQTLKQIAWDGVSIWAVGPPRVTGSQERRQSRARIDLATRAVADAYETQPTSRGMTWDFACGAMWDLAGMDGDQQDQPARELHVRDVPSGSSAWRVSTAATHEGWYSLAHDGCSLWTIDYPAAQLVRLDTSTGAEIERLPAPGAGSIGLTFDGADLWVSNQLDDTLYAIEIGPAPLATGSCTPGLEALVCRAGDRPTVGQFPGRGGEGEFDAGGPGETGCAIGAMRPPRSPPWGAAAAAVAAGTLVARSRRRACYRDQRTSRGADQNSATTTWVYSPPANAVQFVPSYEPDGGDVVTISYDVL